MVQHPAFKTTKRVCVICGKALRKVGNTIETTYGYRTMLRINGIEGDKAHPSCIASLGAPQKSHKKNTKRP